MHPGLGAQRRPAFAAAGCLRKAPALQARLHKSTFGFLTLSWVYPGPLWQHSRRAGQGHPAAGGCLRVWNRPCGIPYNIVARCPAADPRAELELGMGLSSSITSKQIWMRASFKEKFSVSLGGRGWCVGTCKALGREKRRIAGHALVSALGQPGRAGGAQRSPRLSSAGRGNQRFKIFPPGCDCFMSSRMLTIIG